MAKFTKSALAKAQDLVNRKVEEVKTKRTRDVFYLYCAGVHRGLACLEQIDLADFVETGMARCPKCNQLNKTDINNIQMKVEDLL